MRFFIISSRTDRDFSAALHDGLLAVGYEVSDALHGADCVLLVLSPAALDDPTCQQQREQALHLGLHLVLLQITDMEIPHPWSQDARADVRGWNGGAVGRGVLTLPIQSPALDMFGVQGMTIGGLIAEEEEEEEEESDPLTRRLAEYAEPKRPAALDELETEDPPAPKKKARPPGFFDDDYSDDDEADLLVESAPPPAPPQPAPAAAVPRMADEIQDPLYGARRGGAPPPEPAENDAITRTLQDDTSLFDDFTKATQAFPTFAGGGSSAARLLLEFENPQFSAFYPQFIQPSQPYALMVFVHIESVMRQVRDLAAGFAETMGNNQASATTPSQTPIKAATTLTFVPQVPGMTFAPSQQTLTWYAGRDKKTQQNVTFLFQTPALLPADLNGQVLVFNGAILMGEIPLHMHTTTQRTATEESRIQRFDPIFASYSHRDAPVMEYFRKQRQKLGQRMLVDIYDLRAGEKWALRLLEMIDESAAFQLFWSKNSAESPYCRQEWEHAQQYLDARERFIQPVWWESPMHPPPPELAHLHFQKVELPPVTRLRMVTRGITRLFKG